MIGVASMARAIAWRIITPVIIQSNVLLPTKLCARATTLFLPFLAEDEDGDGDGDGDDDACPNSGSRDEESFFFIELSATSHPQSLKCLARAPRPKPQIAFLKFDLSDHSQIILSGYMALPYTGSIVIWRNW